MRVLAVATALALVFGTGGLAHAAESPLTALFDSNHDGCVSLSEYQTYLGRGFTRMDRNHDGVLEAAELPRGSRRNAPLTRKRHRREVARQFHRQDTNHDGCLSSRELMAPPR